MYHTPRWKELPSWYFAVALQNSSTLCTYVHINRKRKKISNRFFSFSLNLWIAVSEFPESFFFFCLLLFSYRKSINTLKLSISLSCTLFRSNRKEILNSQPLGCNNKFSYWSWEIQLYNNLLSMTGHLTPVSDKYIDKVFLCTYFRFLLKNKQSFYYWRQLSTLKRTLRIKRCSFSYLRSKLYRSFVYFNFIKLEEIDV